MIADDMNDVFCRVKEEMAIVRQAVRSRSMTFSMRDANGFTPAEAAELKRRIEDVT